LKIEAIVHDAEEGGFWAKVPAIRGCATEGETMDELMANLHEAIEGCLSIDVAEPEPPSAQHATGTKADPRCRSSRTACGFSRIA
jgi:predicted RNase H-like HicB family nuclease